MTKQEFQENVNNALFKANELMKGLMNNADYCETEDGKFNLSGITSILERLKEISAKVENYSEKDIAQYSLMVNAIDLIEINNQRQREISDMQCESNQIFQKQMKSSELLKRARNGDLSCLDEAEKINEECERLLEKYLDDDDID